MNHQEHQALLSKLMQDEEAKRQDNANSHAHPCVPWRGANGHVGKCVYCGKKIDPITSYYGDRAASGQAALTAHR